MPATRDSCRCTIVPTAARGSRISRTFEEYGAASTTTPTSPFSVTTGMFSCTPLAVPRSMTMTPDHVA